MTYFSFILLKNSINSKQNNNKKIKYIFLTLSLKKSKDKSKFKETNKLT
jgi:hypothetical protein